MEVNLYVLCRKFTLIEGEYMHGEGGGGIWGADSGHIKLRGSMVLAVSLHQGFHEFQAFTVTVYIIM